MALGDIAGGGCLVAPLYVQACSGLWAAGFQGCGEEGMFPDQRTELLSLARWVFMELSILGEPGCSQAWNLPCPEASKDRAVWHLVRDKVH